MLVLVVNCGSSSLKADVIDAATGHRLTRLRVQRLGDPAATARFDDEKAVGLGEIDSRQAFTQLVPQLLGRVRDGRTVAAVGHRVAHGGELYVAPVRVTASVERSIEGLGVLAPLHNPPQLAGIRAARELIPDVPHVAVFDTAFHATLPTRARTYALPQTVAVAHGVRRFGFHGTSHAWVADRAAEFLGDDIGALRIITCHLGSGASVAAVECGRSIETSMGMTPLEGLVMGTRPGDLDPGAVLHLMRSGGFDLEAMEQLLNRESGLVGLSGGVDDMRDIEARAAEGDDRCRLAIRVFAHRLRKYIGAYAAVMGGVDAIVFTGGIGENSAHLRNISAQRLEFLGAHVDEDANRGARVDAQDPVAEISTRHSRCRLLVVASDEQHAIARYAAAIAEGRDTLEGSRRIPIAVSARHIHLTQAAVEALFGAGHQLTPRRPLSQPGQFSCEETLKVIGPRRSIDHVRVLGPTRSANQVEISRTDEFWLGVDAPVRQSGDVANSPGIVLEGPLGTLALSEGLICAARHIHMTPDDARSFGVSDGDVVEVAIDSDGRDLVFGDVVIRVSPKFCLEMHIDTDEANAAELSTRSEGALVATSGKAQLRHRRVR